MPDKNDVFFYEKERDVRGIYVEQKLIPDPQRLQIITDKEIKEALKNNTDTAYTFFEENTDYNGHVTVIRTDRVVKKAPIGGEEVISEKESGPFQLVDNRKIPIIRNHKPCEKCCSVGSCQNAPVVENITSKCCGKCKQQDLILP